MLIHGANMKFYKFIQTILGFEKKAEHLNTWNRKTPELHNNLMLLGEWVKHYNIRDEEHMGGE